MEWDAKAHSHTAAWAEDGCADYALEVVLSPSEVHEGLPTPRISSSDDGEDSDHVGGVQQMRGRNRRLCLNDIGGVSCRSGTLSENHMLPKCHTMKTQISPPTHASCAAEVRSDRTPPD